MAKIYKHSNPYIKKLSMMFMARVLLVVVPIVLLLLIILFIVEENLTAAIILSGLLAITVVLSYTIARYYDILLSGYRGEKKLKYLIKSLRAQDMTAIFTNLPIEFRKRRSELDMLVVNKNGVFIIEVKNHSGIITGTGGCEKWTRIKHGKSGKRIIKSMDNPFRQTGRQRTILKSILSEGGKDVWVTEIVYFTNVGAKLDVSLNKNNHAFTDGNELFKYITKGREILTKKDINIITQSLIGSAH